MLVFLPLFVLASHSGVKEKQKYTLNPFSPLPRLGGQGVFNINFAP